MAFNAKTFNNFLSKDKCEILVNFCKSTDLWEINDGNSYWSGRQLRPNKCPNNIKDILRENLYNIKNTMEVEYGLDEEIYPDTYDLVRWFVGMEQPPHCDDMKNTHITDCRHRHFGCIVYLNNDYTGGHTYYPRQKFEVKPEVGKLAIHLGDCEHEHGVTKIDGSTRYTVASFWTFDKNKSMLNSF